VRRTHLHQRMSDRACEVGVRLMWGNRVTLLSQREVMVNGAPTRFRWLIGADGTASQVRRWAGLGAEKAFSQRVSFRRHYGKSGGLL
jgi:2-polyprenyl-6-methoxyphenol hydroxylase-like FAD-dependent oxidoreductase